MTSKNTNNSVTQKRERGQLILEILLAFMAIYSMINFSRAFFEMYFFQAKFYKLTSTTILTVLTCILVVHNLILSLYVSNKALAEVSLFIVNTALELITKHVLPVNANLYVVFLIVLNYGYILVVVLFFPLRKSWFEFEYPTLYKKLKAWIKKKRKDWFQSDGFKTYKIKKK